MIRDIYSHLDKDELDFIVDFKHEGKSADEWFEEGIKRNVDFSWIDVVIIGRAVWIGKKARDLNKKLKKVKNAVI